MSQSQSQPEPLAKRRHAHMQFVAPWPLRRASVDLAEVYIVDIVDKRATSRIIKMLHLVHPLSELQHCRRVRKDPQGHLVAIVCRVPPDTPEGAPLPPLASLLPAGTKLDGMGQLARAKVPGEAPRTRKQYENSVDLWPITFHENKALEQAMDGDHVMQHEGDYLRYCMGEALRLAAGAADEAADRSPQLAVAASQGPSVCTHTVAAGNGLTPSSLRRPPPLPIAHAAVIGDPRTGKILASSLDERHLHPLRHATMLLIEAVAQQQMAMMEAAQKQHDDQAGHSASSDPTRTAADASSSNNNNSNNSDNSSTAGHRRHHANSDLDYPMLNESVLQLKSMSNGCVFSGGHRAQQSVASNGPVKVAAAAAAAAMPAAAATAAVTAPHSLQRPPLLADSAEALDGETDAITTATAEADSALGGSTSDNESGRVSRNDASPANGVGSRPPAHDAALLSASALPFSHKRTSSMVHGGDDDSSDSHSQRPESTGPDGQSSSGQQQQQQQQQHHHTGHAAKRKKIHEVPHLCSNLDLFVTHEPCAMCCMGLLHSRVSRIFYGVDTRTGGLATHFQIHSEPQLNHHFHVYRGLMADECARLPVPIALQPPAEDVITSD